MLDKRVKSALKIALPIACFLILWVWVYRINDCNHHYMYDMNQDTGVFQQFVEEDNAEGSKENRKDDGNPGQPSVSKGHYLYINLDEHMMYVYKDGQLVKTYPVSGGKPSTPSPTGTWKVISKDTWGEGFGGAWLGFNVPWGKYGIHGTVEPWTIGKSNSSKGCIRMKNKDVRELYKIVPHGAVVKIVHAGRVFRSLKSGDVGSDVVDVQKALKKLKYYNGGIDGKYGSGIVNSVKKFQKDNKINPTGVIGRQTYDLLMKKSAEL